MLTLPNLITVLRLAMLPFLLWLMYSPRLGVVLLGAALFNVAALSDWLDGYLARRNASISRIGTLLDPVVDKIVILSVLFVLVDLRLLPLWIALLSMAREFLVTTVRHAYTTPARVVGANWMGKTKFALQVAVIEFAFVLLAFRSLDRPLQWGRGLLFWAALAVTLLSYVFLVRFIRWHGLRHECRCADRERAVD